MTPDGSEAQSADDAGVDVGVDVGGTTTRVVAFGHRGPAVRRSPTPRGAAALIDHLTAEIRAIAGDAALGCVGVGVPGRVDVAAGVVALALNLGIDAPTAIGPQLGARLGYPVVVENDVNAAALGAFETLERRPHGSLAYLSIGTGFAAGLVLAGEVWRGDRGSAGELGHVPAPGSEIVCSCGQRGCIEARVSGAAIATQAQRLGIGVGAPGLWDAADAGLPAAAAIRAEVVATIAWAVQLSVMVLDVDVVMLGGGVAGLGQRLLAEVATHLGEMEDGSRLLAGIGLGDRLALAPAGVELGALGAVLAARARIVGGRPWKS